LILRYPREAIADTRGYIEQGQKTGIVVVNIAQADSDPSRCGRHSNAQSCDPGITAGDFSGEKEREPCRTGL